MKRTVPIVELSAVEIDNNRRLYGFGLGRLVREVTARGKVATVVSRSYEVSQLRTLASRQAIFFIEITVARQCAGRIRRGGGQVFGGPKGRAGLRRVEDCVRAVAEQLGVGGRTAGRRLAGLEDVSALRGVLGGGGCRGDGEEKGDGKLTDHCWEGVIEHAPSLPFLGQSQGCQ